MVGRVQALPAAVRTSRTFTPTLSLFLATQLALASTSAAAFAADPAPPPHGAVQPVPYAQSQPVPYALQQPPPLPPPAPVAVPAGSDVVVLKSGGMVRGTLLEIIPNDHATVQLATGQTAIIQWDHIHHIERGGGAQANAPAPAPAPKPAPVSEGPTARVHIESDRPVSLERHVSGRVWTFVCAAPCDADVPISQEYRIGGSGVRSSRGFNLAARAGEHVTLDVTTSSTGGFAGGIVLTSLGGLTMVVGLMLVLVGSAQADEHRTFGSTATGSSLYTNDGSANITGGEIALGVGAAAMLLGIIMIGSNSKSSVEQSGEGARAASNAWTRLPTWRTEATATPTPKTTSIPIFSGSF
jgi:hypothetical protein